MKILFNGAEEIGCLYAARLKKPGKNISNLAFGMVYQTKKEIVI